MLTSKSNCNNRFMFMKMNYGEITYKNTNDLIKSNNNFTNVFISNRPFDSKIEIYYEVKITKIGNKNIFIGFIDAEDTSINCAFGFGCSGYRNVFCRKSNFLSNNFDAVVPRIKYDCLGKSKLCE